MRIPQWILGDRLRTARESAGLSQGELADAIGVARATVSSAERAEWLWTGEKSCPVTRERLDYVRVCVSLFNDLPPDDRRYVKKGFDRTVRLILAEIALTETETS